MTGHREVKEFELNGWTIRPCPDEDQDGFDLVDSDVRYHHDHLEVAVAAAQASPRYSPKHVDTDEMVFRLHDTLKYTDFTKLVFKGKTVHRLIQRIESYEKDKPSWKDGTPEDVDRWLHGISFIPEDKLLAFYQWIGKHAVEDYEIRSDEDEGPCPYELPKGHPFCDVQHHVHRHGGGRLPTCRLDSAE